jgi:HB1, ASXL, restriction endonuclease HTH domain
MRDSYVIIAQKVLEARGRPMTAQQILFDAQRFGFLPKHLFGETMPKTLQARISDEIKNNRDGAIFYRTKPGTYFLRNRGNGSKSSDPPRFGKSSRPRIQPLPDCRILYANAPKSSFAKEFMDWPQTLDLLEQRSQYAFISEAPDTSYSVQTFSIVRRDTQVVCYTLGSHSHFQDSVGRKTIGFRRYVDEFDADFFYESPYGVELSAARELLKFLSLSDYAGNDVFISQHLTALGSIVDHDIQAILLVQLLDLSAAHNLTVKFRRRKGIRSPSWNYPNSLVADDLDKYSSVAVAKANFR